MKLVVVGATGLIGTEVLRQALSHKAVTSVVALGRRPTFVPESLAGGASAAKFQSITCDDFSNYSDSVKSQLSAADACIWLLAVTPTKSKTMEWQEVEKICSEYVMNGFDTLKQLPRGESGKPLRFVYASGAMTERDQTKKPMLMADYVLMRGRVETQLLEATKLAAGIMETCILRVGLVKSPERMGMVTSMLANLGSKATGFPVIDIREIGAAAVSAAVNGFEKDTLDNDDLVVLGRDKLKEIGEKPST